MPSVVKVTEKRTPKARQTQRNRTYKRTFLVEFDAPIFDWSEIFTAEDPETGERVPEPADKHPDDEYATVKTIDWNCERESGNLYTATVEYDTDTHYAGWNKTSENELGYSDDPLSRPTVEEWTHERYPVVLTQAYAKWDFDNNEWITGEEKKINGRTVVRGVDIENAAGQEFDPPVMGEETILIRVLTRNQEDWDINEAESYIDTVNSDDWYKFKAGQVRMFNITANKVYESGKWYYRVRYEQHIKEHWYKVVPNIGLAFRNDENELQVCRDTTQNVYTQPVKLRPNGGIVTDHDAPTNYLVFKVFPEKPFTPLLS